MTMYAIHCPPLAGDTAVSAETLRARKVGFSYAGFVFGPFWLIAQRLWLCALVYVVGAALLGFLVALGIFAPPAALALELLAALFIGLEGRSWVGAALARRGLPLVDIIFAYDEDEAARAYFTRALASPVDAPSRASFRSAAPRGNEIIGLFPEARR
jgi:hypothetical protein